MHIILNYDEFIKSNQNINNDLIKQYNYNIKSTNLEKLINAYYDLNIKNKNIFKINLCNIKETLTLINKINQSSDYDLYKILNYLSTTNKLTLIKMYMLYIKQKIATFLFKYIKSNKQLLIYFIYLKKTYNGYLSIKYNKNMKFDRFTFLTIINDKELWNHFITKKNHKLITTKSTDPNLTLFYSIINEYKLAILPKQLTSKQTIISFYINLFRNHFTYAMFDIYNIIELIYYLQKLNITDILEIGSGSGFYAYVITELCKNINFNLNYIATDDDNFRKNWDFHNSYVFYKYINISPENAIIKYKTNTLFFCYAPLNEMAYNILIKFKGTYVIDISQIYDNENDSLTASSSYFLYLKKNYVVINKIILLCSHNLYVNPNLIVPNFKKHLIDMVLHKDINVITIYKKK
jgi:hypothetical protein